MVRKMQGTLGRAACAALVSAIAFAGHAQDETDARDASLEVTIRLLPENAVGPAELTRQIELPPAAARRNSNAPESVPDRENAPPQDGANGRGSEVAAEARERGRDFGQDVAEQARENRESAGRPDEPGPPANLPAPPRGPSDPPGPPTTPPGRP